MPDFTALTTWIVILHVIDSFALITLVLLHSGRGGGVSDMMGGGMSSAAAGSTVVERNLDRATIIFVFLFTFTTLLLSIRLQ